MDKPPKSNAADPAANDVLAQQLGTEYSKIEVQDRAELQKDLQDQATTAEDIRRSNAPDASA